jgi:hypothetical protein
VTLPLQSVDSIAVRRRPFSLIAALSDALHPARRAKDRYFLVVAPVRLYADVSGSADSHYVATAAYVAHAPAWKAFGRTWGAILDDAKVDAFHATDFFNARGEFKGWDLKGVRHLEFAKRFIGAAKKHTAFGTACGFDRRAYQEVLAAEFRGIRAPGSRITPEAYCVINCLANASKKMAKHGVHVAVAVILEEGGGMGEAIEVLHVMRKAKEPWIASFVGFSVMPKSEFPLQAADLLAHEAWRHVTRAAAYVAGEAPMRKSLAALGSKGNVEVKYADREVLMQGLPNVLRAVKLRYTRR